MGRRGPVSRGYHRQKPVPVLDPDGPVTEDDLKTTFTELRNAVIVKGFSRREREFLIQLINARQTHETQKLRGSI